MRWIADLVYLLVGLAYLPIVLYQALFVGKNRSGWAQRLGFVQLFDPQRRRIWIHAVSLGEVNATRHLVERLGEQLPDVDVVVSTTTDTGFARAVELFGIDRVFRYPLDFSPVVSRVLHRVAPTLIVLVELEVWYNLTHMARQRSIPVAVVNGRLTERSARRLAALGPLSRGMFANLTWVGAQDAIIASRFESLGVEARRIEVTSSMKWDSADIMDHVEGTEELAHALGISKKRPLWVCGSTGPDEEEIILSAYRRLRTEWPSVAPTTPLGYATEVETTLPNLAIIPRKPERFDEVARLIERAGFGCIRRSVHSDASVRSTSQSSVILGDTMGELRKFYALADAVFVGRTLVPMGGSDPMEVAALGKPIVVGPYTENFQMPIDALKAAGAVRVVDSVESLASVVGAILRKEEGTAIDWGGRARQVVVENQGATKRTVDRLIRLLDRV